MTDNRTTKLLPCPFCGGEAVLHPTYDMDTGNIDGWFVWCDNDTCECKPETGQFFTAAEAIAAWNTRAELRPTCVYVIDDNTNETSFICTNCNMGYDYIDNWLLKMPHCPNCGATVKGCTILEKDA